MTRQKARANEPKPNRRSREEAELLFRENMRLVYFVANNMDITVSDDVIQDGYMGLWKAALKYDPEKAQSFATYAVPAIRNSIAYARRASLRNLQPEISLNQQIDGDDARMLMDTVPDEKWDHPVKNTEFRLFIDKVLTAEEKRIALMRADGASQRAIGAVFGRSDAWVIERLNRIKMKLKRETKG